MTSLGRLIFFDQPGTGASDPVVPGALPTLEQWADSITAVLDDLGSSEAVLLASNGAVDNSGAVRSHTSIPHNCAGRPRGLRGSAGRARAHDRHIRDEILAAAMSRMWGTGEFQHAIESGHAVERGDSGNMGAPRTPGGKSRDRRSHAAARDRVDVRAVLPTIRVPTLVVQHTDDR